MLTMDSISAMKLLKNTKTVSCLRTISKTLLIRCRKTLTMTPKIRRFLLALKNSLGQNSLKICYRPCWTTTENCLDLKTNNKFWSKRQDREDSQSLRCCHLRRKNYLKKPKKWLTSIHGSCSPIPPLGEQRLETSIVSCSSNLEF